VLQGLLGLTTLAHYLVVVFFGLSGSFPTLLGSCSLGLWPLLVAFMVIQSQTSGEDSTRLLCFPVQVPTKYFPLILVGLFSLLMGPQFAIIIAAGVGWAYAKGHLPFLRFSPGAISDAEARFGVLIQNTTGFVLSSHAAGGITLPGGGGANPGEVEQGSWGFSGVSLGGSPAAVPLSGAARTLGGGSVGGSETPSSGGGDSSTVGGSERVLQGGPRPGGGFGEEQMFLLTGMGFGRDEAREALERHGGDVAAAANSLAV